MSKKLPKDDKGHVIVNGGKTFGNVIKPKYEKKGRAIDLKNKASDRIVFLMKKGVQGDKLSRPQKKVEEKERKTLEFQKEFAEAPKIVQFAHINNRLKDLREELARLEESNNLIKIDLKKSVIEREISECEDMIRELYREIRSEGNK